MTLTGAREANIMNVLKRHQENNKTRKKENVKTTQYKYDKKGNQASANVSDLYSEAYRFKCRQEH